MYDVREVEHFDQAGELGFLDVRENRGADCADEKIVGCAVEVGTGIESSNSYIVPLPVNLSECREVFRVVLRAGAI